MRDAHIARLAGAQFNRISRAQLRELGDSPSAIQHRLAKRKLVIVERGVFGLPPVLEHDDWGRWSAATLTAPGSVLSHASAAAAWGLWSAPRTFETVTRPGTGGPRRHGGVLVFRSLRLDGNRTTLRGIPLTTAERTVLDLASHVSERSLARAVREAVRLGLTNVEGLADALGRHLRHRGSSQLSSVIARYSGLPLHRARSGAEVRALEVLRAAGWPMPNLNARVAGEEADLSWPDARLIIEVDGGPFHLDRGEDLRKRRRWERGGWTVRRIPADDVYDDPARLLSVARIESVPRSSP